MSIIKTPKQFNQVVILMRVIIKDNQFVIIIKPKPIYFGLFRKVDNNLKPEIDFSVKHNEILPKLTVKNEVCRILLKYNHGKNILEHRKQ